MFLIFLLPFLGAQENEEQRAGFVHNYRAISGRRASRAGWHYLTGGGEGNRSGAHTALITGRPDAGVTVAPRLWAPSLGEAGGLWAGRDR